MNILIKDMTLEEFSDYGEYCQTLIGTGQAEEVPSHGRLIDADELVKAMARMVPWAIVDPTANAFLDGLSAAYEAINAAPTIIEASQEEI